MPYKDPAKQAAAKRLWRESNRAYFADYARKKQAERDQLDPSRAEKRAHLQKLKDCPEYAAEHKRKQKEKARAGYVPKPRKASAYPSPEWAMQCERMAWQVRHKTKQTAWDVKAKNMQRSIELARIARDARVTIAAMVASKPEPENWADAVLRICKQCLKTSARQKNSDLCKSWKSQASRWSRNFAVRRAGIVMYETKTNS
jgi:hypothetical protein